MNDVTLLRTNPDLLAEGFARRSLDVDLDALADLDVRRRKERSVAEELRARQKEAGKEKPVAKKPVAKKPAAPRPAAEKVGSDPKKKA